MKDILITCCDFRTVQFCISEALFNAAKGNFTDGFLFAGTQAYLAEKILSVKEAINQLKNEYFQERFRIEMIKNK